jgi:CBS domain containing-hemolysin-like protein
MSGNFKVLGTFALTEETTLDRPRQELPESVKLNDPAMNVVTDLSKVAAMTINPCASMENASERMIASNVRLLFVTDQFYNVMGLVTSRDLLGDRAIQYIQEHGGKRSDIMVRDIMTPRHKIEVLSMDQIRQAKVGDIIETLRNMGRQHALVMDNTGSAASISGIISTTQVSKQTGEEINIAGITSTIAEMAAARSQ